MGVLQEGHTLGFSNKTTRKKVLACCLPGWFWVVVGFPILGAILASEQVEVTGQGWLWLCKSLACPVTGNVRWRRRRPHSVSFRLHPGED